MMTETQQTDIHVGAEQITGYFDALPDPRSEVNRRHPLQAVLVIAIMAVLAGANGPTAIAAWAKIKAPVLIPMMNLQNGVPRKDVFRRVLTALKPEAFTGCFTQWLTSLQQTAAAASGVTQPVIAVDGKTLRRSHDTSKGLGALHTVTAFARDYGLTLGQVACGDKSNEITAIPELLMQLNLHGAIVTIDAMGTQKAIAATIIDAGADDVLAVKGNQPTLENDVTAALDAQIEAGTIGSAAQEHTTVDNGHGRTDTRTYVQMPVPASLISSGVWKGIVSIGVVILASVRQGVETIDKRYYISSLPVDVTNFARAVRGHWGIENSCHWCLDVTFREDESRIRGKAIRQNVAWLRRVALSLLRQKQGKSTIALLSKECSWSEQIMLEVLTGSKT